MKRFTQLLAWVTILASATVAALATVPAAIGTLFVGGAITAFVNIASGAAPAILGVINASAVSNTIQPYYSKKLLDHAIQATELVNYAQLEEVSPNAGNTSVRFFRPPAADLTATGAPAALTEGTAPTNFRDISYTAIDVSLAQIGQVSKVTDIANTAGLVKYLDTAIQLQGEEFALDVDTRIRNVLCHASTGATKRYAQGSANFAALAAATAANGCLVPRDFLDALTNLKINRAPKINGVYVAILPPQHSRDILNNSEFREVVRQNYADKIFKGEIGAFYNCRFVEGTNPFQEDETEGTNATSFSAAGTNTTGFIYSTIVTGKGSYGAVNMKKLGATPHKPQVIIVDKPDKTDPLAQYLIAGWKAYWASTMLNTNWAIALRGKTQYA
jgi:N4-gp56 family major capsid protein